MGLGTEYLATTSIADLKKTLKSVGEHAQNQIKREIKRRTILSSKMALVSQGEARARKFGKRGPTNDACEVRQVLGFIGGDASKALVFTIPGEPKPKKRPRFGKGRAYSAPEQIEDEARLRNAMMSLDVDPFTGTLALVCIFYRSTQRRVDTDNLVKQIMDASTGILWYDDDQVTATAKFLEVDRDHPRVAIGVVPYSCSVRRVQKGDV